MANSTEYTALTGLYHMVHKEGIQKTVNFFKIFYNGHFFNIHD